MLYFVFSIDAITFMLFFTYQDTKSGKSSLDLAKYWILKKVSKLVLTIKVYVTPVIKQFLLPWLVFGFSLLMISLHGLWSAGWIY